MPLAFVIRQAQHLLMTPATRRAKPTDGALRAAKAIERKEFIWRWRTLHRSEIADHICAVLACSREESSGAFRPAKRFRWRIGQCTGV